MRLLLLCLLLAGCSPQLIYADGMYLEVSGNIQRRTGASDWVLTDGNGTSREYIGQVMLVAGYEWRGLAAFAGFSHQSFPEYGYDRGLNGPVLGIGYRWNF